MKIDDLITNGEKNFLSNSCKKHRFQEYKTRQTKYKQIVKINLFWSYKERTKYNVVIFSKILPNNQIITACCIELRVQEMNMNEKLTMIGLI